jgi:hypothetical protein
MVLYKQLICPMMDYTWLIWRSAACIHVRNCKCCNPSAFTLRLTHFGIVVTGKFMRIWFFVDNIRAAQSFDSKLADTKNILVWHLGRHLCQPRAEWSHPRTIEEDWRSAGQLRLPLGKWPSWHNDNCLTLPSHSDWGFACFSSFVR